MWKEYSQPWSALPLSFHDLLVTSRIEVLPFLLVEGDGEVVVVVVIAAVLMARFAVEVLVDEAVWATLGSAARKVL